MKCSGAKQGEQINGRWIKRIKDSNHWGRSRETDRKGKEESSFLLGIYVWHPVISLYIGKYEKAIRKEEEEKEKTSGRPSHVTMKCLVPPLLYTGIKGFFFL